MLIIRRAVVQNESSVVIKVATIKIIRGHHFKFTSCEKTDMSASEHLPFE